jgi:formylglycine-generating enzyme required for sulfatase activity
LILLLLGYFVVLKFKTPDGVIVLENVPKDAEILVDGSKISFTWPGGGKPVEVRAVLGQHKLEVKKDGFKTFGKEVTFKADDSEEVTVRLEPLVVFRPEPNADKVPDPKPEPVDTIPGEPKVITNTLGMKLVLIPAGEFQMGSPASDKDAAEAEKPPHRVRITRPFYLGATEVTVGQFRHVVEATGFRTEAETDGKGGWGWNEAKGELEQDPKYTWRNPGFPQTDEHPVV